LTAVDSLGGIQAVYDKLLSIDPNYLSLTPTSIKGQGFSALALFILGWICAGFGVIGQPHIMMRFITLDNPQNMKRARIYYYSWYGVFSLLTIVVGLCARLLIPEASAFDAELALPTISKILLPEVLVGLILAGLFAATMSTADSQVLSCSSAMSKDILPQKKNNLLFTKMSTVFVAVFSILIALYGGTNVFNLVIVAWSILAAAFAPLITLFVFRFSLTENECLLISITGVITTLLWRNFGLSSTLAEVGPGLASGFIIFGICQMLKKRLIYKKEGLDIAS
ncbi:MAG: sodium/proline symporter, partial [Bdellovibrionota bacterium]|nr:sodium/proline symporter [Bdellovibrionota bacterium]